jgi:enoyl-CoA hydratase/carnithine racemase
MSAGSNNTSEQKRDDEDEARVVCERHEAVATLTLSHPSALNAMTWGMYEQLYQFCEELEADETVRVLVLQGAGMRAFVAGTDISQFREFRGADDGIAYEARLDRIVGRLESLTKPTIARLRGYTVGGGASLAIACDLRIAASSLRFGVPIARTLGNCLSAQNLARIVDLVGPSRAKQLIYTAELLDAETCLALGLVNEIVAEEQLDERVDSLAATICAHAPLTLAASKRTIGKILAQRRTGSDQESIRSCYGSRDFQEGVAAFLEKRKPVWEGR